MEHYAMDAEQVAKELNISLDSGLSQQEAEARLLRHGLNALTEARRKPLWLRFLLQFKDVMIAILMAAALISLFVGEHGFGPNAEGAVDAAIIFVVIMTNAILGVAQESKAEKALDALKKMSAPTAKALRGGIRQVVPADQLAPGDIIFVEAGDLVPADARIFSASSLMVEESSLTGESVPSGKHANTLGSGDIPIGDRKNMLFATGIVTYGRGAAVITSTGMETQVGRIAKMLQSEKDEATPLQIKLTKIGKYLGIMALGICALIFILGLLEGKPPFEMFMASVSLAVAAIPEGLPAVVTIVLATGISRLVKQNAIIRSLPAVETLGCASVICSDKTGTLTQNKMTVIKHFVSSLHDLTGSEDGTEAELLKYACLCCDATVTQEDGAEKRRGDPTETALVSAALKAGFAKDELERQMPRVDELPFDSERKMMTTVHKLESGWLSITKGAPDIVLSRCQGSHELNAAHEANREMAQNALRVLAVAVKRFDSLPAALSSDTLETDLQFVGLLGMTDPPREEAKHAVALCRAAGIRPVMITGDHIETAIAIARQLNMLRPGDKAITGAELSALSDEELQSQIGDYSVYARVAPEHKVRIVRAWQKAGEVVAMTGDGVNDAPALKAADIGCAMGITGTDVARGAAHMVLTDDNFATIVVAVREGRAIYGNIIRSIKFLLATNLSEILVILASVVMKWATPLAAVHLLWINLVTDSLPALALGMEPVDHAVMKNKPRRKDESIFAHGFATSVVLQGLMVGALVITAFLTGRLLTGVDPSQLLSKNDAGITMAFIVMSLAELVHAFNLKSTKSLFKTGVHNNPYLIGAFFVGTILQLMVALTPTGRSLFGLYDLTGQMWLIVAALSVMPIFFMEIFKLLSSLKSSKKIKT